VQNKNQPAGLVCPQCSAFIEVSIQSLLHETSFMCPCCLTTFSMDRNESKEAHDLMQNPNAAVNNLKITKE
jgi:uncharacterized paraquat-inducible protein A